ncbi:MULTISPECIES: YfaZ family outer membrane protein [Chromohalobacter]|uniref:YfaZ family outer membrane protein n=1 Tax=Chromohalobacter canadensis TaxID=141389 RepID=A0ABZ0YF95_9GAMM|nr:MULTISPECIES: YfaZ family outer membrane protein [Chromohalobacter]MCK0769334.1 YfaZ family protein [Chromohalobacter canadensis]WQH10611.1 YfaZ family outer membrane protein [Chromohalobacter canadensis]
MIKSLGFALTSAGLLLASQQAMALSVSANAGADSHGIEASQSIFPTLRASAGYFTSDDSGHDADTYSGSLMFSPYLPLVDLSVGARYQYQDTHFGDGGGVGLGGSAYVDTPIPLTSVGGYGFYTPDGLSHGDIEKSYEYGAQARVNVVSQTYLYGGYRYYRTDFDESGEHTLDSGPVVGVSVGF